MRQNVFRRDRLRDLMYKRGMTQAQLAAQIGVDQASVSAYLLSRQPMLPVLVAIANVFEVSVDYLVGRSDNPTDTYMSNDDKLSRDAFLLVQAFRNRDFFKLIRMAVEQAEKDAAVARHDSLK
ncbi:MAG: helix-turn-helix transcriptional regulator [Chloroflexi bacterium]|nr:helix-turn-helix transcriptional regulator [Chloroflexota bacterium]